MSTQGASPSPMTSNPGNDEDGSETGHISPAGLGKRISHSLSQIDEADAKVRYNQQNEDNTPSADVPNSVSSSTASVQKQVISWPDGDPENPYNWSEGRKVFIVASGIITVFNSTMSSSLPSNAISYIIEDFNVTSPLQTVLPISGFLLGYVFGPLLFGPLSEKYGRKWIMLSTFFGFTIFTTACAIAPNWPAFIIFRLITGIFAASPIAVVPGTYADIYGDPDARGQAMCYFMVVTVGGPLVAPIISGYISPIMGWRWTFWIGLIICGASWPTLLLLPETYGPTLLAKRARQLREATSNPNLFAPIELEKTGFKQLATVTLTRPFRMILFELIVGATCVYLSFAYAIFYMYFEAYPIVFEGIYHMSTGVSGLMFLPIGAGSLLAMPIFWGFESILRKARANNASWTHKEESRRLPLAYIGGPFYVIALFWLGWSAREDVHWVVPFLAGIPFGIGYLLIFMALLNYVTDAYEIFAASAMAATSCCRSLAGAVLPLAAKPMYDRLGVAWASSLLAFLSLAMCAIPFGFVHWGETIRERSRFCTYLRERKEKERLESEAARDEGLGRRAQEKV